VPGETKMAQRGAKCQEIQVPGEAKMAQRAINSRGGDAPSCPLLPAPMIAARAVFPFFNKNQ